MNTPTRSHGPRGVMVRRLLLGLALLFAVAAWTAVGVAYVMRPGIAMWATLVTIAAVSLEILFWTAAGVFGWSFLAKRRAMLDRFFKKSARSEGDPEP
jgi:arginine exporter protein ArgO